MIRTLVRFTVLLAAIAALFWLLTAIEQGNGFAILAVLGAAPIVCWLALVRPIGAKR